MECPCSAWDVDRIEPGDESAPFAEFSFILNAVFIRLRGDDDEEDDDVVKREVSLPYDVVMGVGLEQASRASAIRYMVSGLGVDPVEPVVVRKILDCAEAMSANKRFAGRRVLRMEVHIEVTSVNGEKDEYYDGDDMVDVGDDDDEEEEEEEEEEYLMSEDEYEDMVDEEEEEREWRRRCEGASEAAIEGLRKVSVVEGIHDVCSICCEDLGVGCEATYMPCSHKFHGDCITKWLVISKFCPLCRFQLNVI